MRAPWGLGCITLCPFPSSVSAHHKSPQSTQAKSKQPPRYRQSTRALHRTAISAMQCNTCVTHILILCTPQLTHVDDNHTRDQAVLPALNARPEAARRTSPYTTHVPKCMHSMSFEDAWAHCAASGASFSILAQHPCLQTFPQQGKHAPSGQRRQTAHAAPIRLSAVQSRVIQRPTEAHGSYSTRLMQEIHHPQPGYMLAKRSREVP